MKSYFDLLPIEINKIIYDNINCFNDIYNLYKIYPEDIILQNKISKYTYFELLDYNIIKKILSYINYEEELILIYPFSSLPLNIKKEISIYNYFKVDERYKYLYYKNIHNNTLSNYNPSGHFPMSRIENNHLNFDFSNIIYDIMYNNLIQNMKNYLYYI